MIYISNNWNRKHNCNGNLSPPPKNTVLAKCLKQTIAYKGKMMCLLAFIKTKDNYQTGLSTRQISVPDKFSNGQVLVPDRSQYQTGLNIRQVSVPGRF